MKTSVVRNSEVRDTGMQNLANTTFVEIKSESVEATSLVLTNLTGAGFAVSVGTATTSAYSPGALSLSAATHQVIHNKRSNFLSKSRSIA